MGKISNVDLWNKLREAYPNFKSHTSKGTAETFTETGFNKLKDFDPSTLNDFFKLSMRVYLQLVNVSHAVDKLEAQGFGEYFEQSYGGYIQRMATTSIKPISPVFKNLKNGESIDPFKIRKPEVLERFFKQNFDYQSFITISDDYQLKQIFVNEFGVSEFMAGIMAGLENGYTIQKYVNKLEALNAAIRPDGYKLQDTQFIDVELPDIIEDATDEQLKGFILSINNIVTAIDIAPQTDKFNALKFASTQDKGRLKLLVRAGLKNVIRNKTLAGTFNPEYLNMGIDIVEVPHFGGLIPKINGKVATVRTDTFGTVIGYSETPKGEIKAEPDEWEDPNKDVIGMIADKGLIFESKQNSYKVEPIRNPMGLYTNYICTSENNTIAVDPIYNMIVIKKKSA